jgi:hypothetical protein
MDVIRMQESVVSMDEGTNKLCLSGQLSEWLFSSGFWSDFNAEHGTMFDQFEEDEAKILTVKAIVKALNERIQALQGLDECSIEFVYRWTAEHKPLTTSVPRDLLLLELITLKNFLVDAVTKNCSVTFSL